jgi:hypothetical protein
VRRLLVNRWLAGAVVVLLAGVLGVELARWRDRGDLPTATAAEVRVARDFAVAITSFDYRRLDADRDRLLGLAAPSYRAELEKAVGPAFIAEATRNKRVSVGTVARDPILQDRVPGQAVFVVTVSQRITSDGSTPAAQDATPVIVVAMTTGSDPKVTNLKPL